MPTAFARTNGPRRGTARRVLQPDLGKPRLAWWRTQSCQTGLRLRFPVKQGKSMDSGRKRPAPAPKTARSRGSFEDFRVGCAKFQTGNSNRGNREFGGRNREFLDAPNPVGALKANTFPFAGEIRSDSRTARAHAHPAHVARRAPAEVVFVDPLELRSGSDSAVSRRGEEDA